MFESVDEMESVGARIIFDAEVVDTEGEADGAPFVGPETWCELALLVAVFVEALLE